MALPLVTCALCEENYVSNKVLMMHFLPIYHFKTLDNFGCHTITEAISDRRNENLYFFSSTFLVVKYETEGIYGEKGHHADPPDHLCCSRLSVV